MEDANAHIFHLETKKTSSSQSNETIADVNASDFIWNPILVKSVKWNNRSCKCTFDSYKVKSSSNQSKETFGNANALLFHKISLLYRSQATLMLHPSKLKSFSNFFAKVTQNLSRSVNKHSKYHQQSAIHIKSNPPQINQKKHLGMQIHLYFINFSLVT